MNRSLAPSRSAPGRSMLLFCLLCLPLLAAGPARGAQVLRILQLGVQLRVPDTWRLLETPTQSGAVLGGGEDPDARMEVVVWQPIASGLSAAAAAGAHEQVLGASLSYTHRSAQHFTAADGSEAVLTHGLVETADGARAAALFAAYCIDGTYYVLGTFCSPEQTEHVLATYLTEATRTFSKTGTRLPEMLVAPAPGTHPATRPTGDDPLHPQPATVTTDPPPTPDDPPAPDADPGPAPEPTATRPDLPTPPADPPPAVEDPTPSVVPRDFSIHRDPLGFAMAAPQGWAIATEDGCITCWPPERPRKAGLVIWPVLSGQAPGEQRVQFLARSLAMRLRTTWRTVSTRRAGESDRVWVCRGEMVVDDEPLQAVAVLARSENLDVLTLLLARDGLPAADRLTLARALSSFESVPLWVDASPATTPGVWIAQDGALRADPPPGWEVAGGVVLYNEMPAIEVQGVHRGTGARFYWRQPELPCLKHPSQRLLDAGWKEGAHFAPDRGVDSLVLAARVTAVTACRDRTMAGNKVGVTKARELLTAAAMLEGGEGAYASTETAEMVATCIGAVGAAPQEFGRDCWMVATLMVEASQDTVASTCAALRAFIESVRLLDGWPATEEQRRTLRARVAGAREAVQALPPAPESADTPAPAIPALDHLVPDGSARAIQGEVPVELSRLWRLASSEDTALQQLPELLEGVQGK